MKKFKLRIVSFLQSIWLVIQSMSHGKAQFVGRLRLFGGSYFPFKFHSYFAIPPPALRHLPSPPPPPPLLSKENFMNIARLSSYSL
ncbi:hypothetical protein L6452_10477 [Arctium lappa]|uniref:Uncharacterized protein n=1 Tax=Arctium lappa TaxID=4217 RepID=A0ACB9DMN4_ARCLA|nr:hypothetical protein L6452_10477 [Arctium lappa]